MARGLYEKIAFRIRPGFEDEDRLRAEEYIEKIKAAPENKNQALMVREVIGSEKETIVEMVFMPKNQESPAVAKGYKQHIKNA